MVVGGGPGPREGSGEACLKEGVGEWSEGEPDERVDALNGLSGFSCGRRIGSGPGRDGRSCGSTIRIRKAAITCKVIDVPNPCFPYGASYSA
jgi:hypothetical protein